jgi:magnesium transporter
MIVDAGRYVDGLRVGGGLDIAAIERAIRCDDGGFVWVGLYEPTPGEFERYAEVFGLHPVAVEDAVLAHQRPKIETYDDVTLVVLKTASYHHDQEVVEFGEIQVFLGARFALVVRHGVPAPLGGARTALEADPGFLGLGPTAVLHAVIDRVVDEYGSTPSSSSPEPEHA